MDVDRRQFLQQSALAAGALGLGVAGRVDAETARADGTRPLAVATWEFGQTATGRALAVMAAGGAVLDAVEQGVCLVESFTTLSSVGPGGVPNAAGVVQLDACIMGPDHRAGSVAALAGFAHPISVARRVMEKTPHVMLVGEGAGQFALEQGMEPAPTVSARRRREWEEWKAQQAPPGPGPTHDTLALLVVDAGGAVAGGCSTSGWGYKLPGRVGDSPILGSGLYVDGSVGAAGATGLGEDIMRYCGSFLIVEFMRQGLTPQQACEAAVQRIGRAEGWRSGLSASFVALDIHGQCGAAGTGEGIAYAVTSAGSTRVEQSAGVWEPRQ